MQGLQKQVVEEKGDIESRIAEPGDLAIEQDRALGADEDILGTEVAVDETKARVCQALRFLVKENAQKRMTIARGHEVGFDTELAELRRGGETGAGIGVVPGAALDCRQNLR